MQARSRQGRRHTAALAHHMWCSWRGSWRAAAEGAGAGCVEAGASWCSHHCAAMVHGKRESAVAWCGHAAIKGVASHPARLSLQLLPVRCWLPGANNRTAARATTCLYVEVPRKGTSRGTPSGLRGAGGCGPQSMKSALLVVWPQNGAESSSGALRRPSAGGPCCSTGAQAGRGVLQGPARVAA